MVSELLRRAQVVRSETRSGSRARVQRRWWRIALCSVMGAGSAGCEIDAVTVANPATAVVVHSVLNPDAPEQVILVEELLTGRVAAGDSLRLDLLDPIVTAGGEPIIGASVALFADADTVGVVAQETRVVRRGVERGTGRYTVARRALAVVPGARYRLRVRTNDGREVTGETRLPGPVSGWVPGGGLEPVPVPLNRTTDTLRLAWEPVANAQTYAIRVDTPNGPWFLFSDSTQFSLSGALRNFFAGGLPAVWYPGFRQNASVAAVDRNFYDYNRSGNDPFGGSGLISSVQGGLGLFGSVVPVLRREVVVTQTPRLPLDARWEGRTPSDEPYDLDLWIETPGPSISSVSGRVAEGADRFVLGTLQGDDIRLAFLRPARLDTVALFTGRVVGDSISGSYSDRFATDGPRGWRRVGPP